nr:light-harvesting complex-like protein OHP2, chloroplastic [Ipomoea batatas]
MPATSSPFSYIKIPKPPVSSSCTSMRFCATRPIIFTVKSSQAEGPFRRPVAPSPPTPRQKAKELQEYFKQKKAEEANQGPFFGFIGKNEISNGSISICNNTPFGFLMSRWAMFGFAVGMLTEYATGSDFVDQVKILLSNFGILDLE